MRATRGGRAARWGAPPGPEPVLGPPPGDVTVGEGDGPAFAPPDVAHLQAADTPPGGHGVPEEPEVVVDVVAVGLQPRVEAPPAQVSETHWCGPRHVHLLSVYPFRKPNRSKPPRLGPVVMCGVEVTREDRQSAQRMPKKQ